MRADALLAAAIAILGWLALFALGLLIPFGDWALPLTPLAGLAGGIIGLSPYRWPRRVLWSSVTAICLASAVVAFTPLVTTLPTRDLIRRDASPHAPLDAVIVLSGGITSDSLLAAQALDRLLSALELMRDSVAPTLVVTRARRGPDGVPADPDQQRLRALVARPFAMLVIDSVRTTRDEAVNAARFLRSRGILSIALVTSPLHTRRACAAFERVGFRVTCVPARSRDYSVAHADNAMDRLALFRAWIYECMAWLKYKRRGWV